MKLSLFFYLAVFLFLFSCNNDQTKTILTDDTLARDSIKILRDSLQMDEFRDKNLVEKSQSSTFPDSCYVYSKPDLNSLPIGRFPMFTNLTIFGNRPIISNGVEWYKVETQDKKIGFIDVQDLIFGEFENQEKGYKLVLGVREKRHLGSMVSINRVRLHDNKVTEILELPLISSPFVTKISSTTLMSALQVLKYETSSEECPGITEDYYIIDNGNKLILLAKGTSSGESSWYQSSIVYIPIKLTNGKVMLVANGNINNIFNSETGELNVFHYTEDIGIPIENLIVIKNEEVEYEFDEDYNPIENKDGTYKIASENYSTEYYSWNGKVVTKIR